MTLPNKIIFGTRGSALARRQTETVAARLQEIYLSLQIETVIFSTRGDKELNKPLPEIGGKGLFTAELESALRDSRIDLAVHSLKDLPTQNAPGLTIGAILPRENPADALVSGYGYTLDTLPPNATVGTSSPRRAAQLLAYRPDLNIISLRGNVDTRIRKALDPTGPYHAVILAAAGLNRMKLAGHVTHYLSADVMLPAPGQGAVAVQCRADDKSILKMLAALNHLPTHRAVEAERAFLAQLGGGCSVPVGAWGQLGSETLTLTGVVADPRGRQVIRVQHSGSPTQAKAIGETLARQALQQGADAILNQLPSSDKKPLRNRRILVTRAAGQNAKLTEQLLAAGAAPVEFPTLQFALPTNLAPLDKAIANLRTYHWLVLTSTNGVQFFQDRLTANGKTTADLKHLQVAAIGPATAQAAQTMGLPVTVMPTEHIAEALAAAMGTVKGQQILYPTADIARATLQEELEAKGAIVTRVTAYRTIPAGEADPLRQLLPDIDIITFTSSSTVENFVALLADDDPAGRIGGAVVACIGPKTAATAQHQGLPVHVVAGDYTIAGLVEAMKKYY